MSKVLRSIRPFQHMVRPSVAREIGPIFCIFCGQLVPQRSREEDPRGRLKRYCSRSCKSKQARVLSQQRKEARRERAVELLVSRPTLEERRKKPLDWWVSQAHQVSGRCQVCEGPIEGMYIPPTVETQGECAVVAHCRVCGRERMLLAGRNQVPYEENG